jgi:hypothetical protein
MISEPDIVEYSGRQIMESSYIVIRLVGRSENDIRIVGLASINMDRR